MIAISLAGTGDALAVIGRRDIINELKENGQLEMQ